ncbi:hypothetical protein BsWGS_14243 [Bradybaena similaris]
MSNLYIFILVSILSFDWSISQEEGLKPPNIATPRVRMDLYYNENTNVAVNCSADGNPAPTYKWMQNGTEIVPGQFITFDPAAGTLRIASFSRREEATYLCTASNSFGSNKVVSFAAPVRLWQTRVERFTGDAVTQQVQNHEYLRLLCNKKAVVGSTIKFNWYSAESTSINLDNNRLFIDQEGNLHFTYLIDTDANLKYMCGISVDQDKQIVLGTINNLVVNPNSNISPIKPYLQYSNSGVKGLRFSSAKLECMFSGYNPDSPSIPTITWRDDSGKIIQNSAKFSLSQDRRTLTIMNILEEDEKYYSCYAQNPAGEASGTVFLNVTSGPIFVNGAPIDVAKSQYTDAQFSCDTRSASGETPPSPPVWSINGEKMGPQTMPITIVKEPPSVQGINYGDNVDLTVTATTDPAMVLNYRWVFDNKSYTGSEHPPYMYYNPNNNLAYINTSSLTQEQYGEIGGVYQRVIYHQFDSKTVEVEVILKDRQAASTAGGFDLWIIGLIIALLLLIIIILIIIYIICRKKQEGDYNVDKKETGAGLDPEKELKEKEFNAYSRPVYDEYAVYPDTKPPGDPEYDDGPIGGDDESLGEYGKEDVTYFNEDGSFIGIYQSKKVPTAPQPTESTI